MKTYKVIIIGSGFGGLAAAYNLRQININDFLILERDAELGGTWWCNSYPGAAVDVQSHLYSLSFESFDWTRLFAQQKELLAYTNHIIDKYNIRAQARTNSNVANLAYDETTGIWTITLDDGTLFQTESVINASGGLSQAKTPEFEGLQSYQGVTMHTNRWNHDYDYKGKRVAIIGTGASGVQAIPELAKDVEHLYVFQRTPHWIMPRPDRILGNFERSLGRKFPFIKKLYRWLFYWLFELRVLAFCYFPNTLPNLISFKAKRNLTKAVKDKKLQEKLLPDYTMGCKRILMSNDYYPTYNRENVTLFTKTSAIQSFTKTGIQTTDGQEIEVDLVVFATGFHAAEKMIPYSITGKDGISINTHWKDGAHAYLGTTTANFPNLYFLAGPNTGTGHTSALHFIESQLIYICKMLQAKTSQNLKAIEVKATVETAYNQKLQADLKKTVWSLGGCKSWYQTESGKITTLYPSFSFKFRNDCRKAKLSKHN